MADITVSSLIEKLKQDLERARERVRTLQEQLEWLENQAAVKPDIEQDVSEEAEIEPSELSLVAPSSSPGETTVGRAIRELMENAPGEFNVPGVAKAISRQFPNVSYKELSRKGSQISSRLAKRGVITLVKKGTGREPHVYKSTKYVDKT